MTYCVGMMVDRGLVLMSDTRTNSGVDNISVFRKTFHWHQPGERIVALMTAGNLATTQMTISRLEEQMNTPDGRGNVLLTAPTMFDLATKVGRELRSTIAERQDANGDRGQNRFTATMILAGQIAGMAPRLFLIYPEGNFIEASLETPFFQIGETKYGRPIIVRAHHPSMSLEDAVKLLLTSFDATLKANLSVGMPFDLMVIERDAFAPSHVARFEQDDAYFNALSSAWGAALTNAFHSLPDYSFHRERSG